MTSKVAELVTRYSKLFHEAEEWDTPGNKVGSPFGAWLLLAVLTGGKTEAFTEADAARIETILGTDIPEAYKLAVELLGAIPEEVKLAAAAWYSDENSNSAIKAWAAAQTESDAVTVQNSIPTQQELNDWASDNTNGLITEFPIEVNDLTFIILATAVATEISWMDSYEPTENKGDFWKAKTLLHSQMGHTNFIQHDEDGIWGVHAAFSDDSIAVISVVGLSDAPRELVQAKANEFAQLLCTTSFSAPDTALPLSELRLGKTNFITVSEVTSRIDQDQVVSILPAWEADSSFTLAGKGSTVDLGFQEGSEVFELSRDFGADVELEVKQVAKASYTKYGFKAAAVTALHMMVTSAYRPTQFTVRKAVVDFEHSFAVTAVHYKRVKSDSLWQGIPLFDAWVVEAEEA